MSKYVTLFGKTLETKNQISYDKAEFVLLGEKEGDQIPISKDLLSKHILVIGGIGTGKTNTINLLLRNLMGTMNENDVMIIFDPKKDYYNDFHKEGDIIVSNDETCNAYWNIFNEIMIDNRIEENINEIASYFYKDRIDKSSNPFFPSAAKDVFASLLSYIIRKNKTDLMNNKALRNLVDTVESKDYISIFKKYDDLSGICSYIADDAKGQAQGVMAEYKQALREILIGNFKKEGDFSIRQTVRNRGNKVIYIEYDLGLGRTLAPIYSLLFDLAIKEALCRQEDEKGNVYFIIDEFRLLRPLSHMDNGINFGRSLGAKFVLGLQNAEQVYDVYGENAGRSILSGCNTLIGFNVSDKATRELIEERGGESIKLLTRQSQIRSRGIQEDVQRANCIEDADIRNLEVGQAIVQYGQLNPFIFKFKKFEKDKK